MSMQTEQCSLAGNVSKADLSDIETPRLNNIASSHKQSVEEFKIQENWVSVAMNYRMYTLLKLNGRVEI